MGESKSEDLKIIQAFQYTPKTTEKKSSGKAENFDRHSSENSLDDKEEDDIKEIPKKKYITQSKQIYIKIQI